jgi:hypothetical protein
MLYSEQMIFISLNNKSDLIKAVRNYKPNYMAKDLSSKTKAQLICILANVEFKFKKGE